MKRLIMINGKGKQYDLLDPKLSPTFQVSGLGFYDETAFARVGDTFIPLEETTEQGLLEMSFLFLDSADIKYHEFAKTLRYNPLTLLYENDKGTFYYPCRMRSLEKTDRKGYNVYGCKAEFVLTGRPYEVIYGYNSGEISLGKNYGLNGYTYDYTYSNDILNAVILKSNSLVESSCIITIYGEVINPVWRHYVENKLVESGAYDGTISDGHYLVIDSRSFPYSIIEYDGSGNVVADRYQLCDFSTERFMKINEGSNRYSISHEGIGAVKMKVEAYVEYETV